MPRKIKDSPSLAELFNNAADTLKQSIREPNIAMYEPHEKQLYFHKSDDYGRLYIGGNRSGKSYGAVVEDIWWCTDTHPYIETPPAPVRGRVVAVDFDRGVKGILLPLFKRLCTPSMLIDGSWDKSWSLGDRTLTFANGSTIEFMSYEQDTDKFAGTSRHFIHYDEEPPKNVFDECQMRIIDTEGSFWISMTPVEGITWVFDVLYDPTVESPDSQVIVAAGENYGQVVRNPKTEIMVIEVDMDENPYLTAKGRQRAMATLDGEEDIIARKSGKFVQMGGRIFKSFNPDIHVIDSFVPPKEWDWYMSIDHGWNNPTAVLWHAVSPDGTVYTFSEHYKSEMTIEQHATTIHMREAMWGKVPEIRTGDPAMKQTTAVTGTSIVNEYGDRGIYLSLDSVPRDVAIGIARMQQYFRINPGTGKPKWFITADCVNFISEIKKLRWKKYASKKAEYQNNKREEIHKKDDHACDSARYFSTFLPELSLSEYEDPAFPEIKMPTVNLSYAGAVLKAVNEGSYVSSDTKWDVVEGIDYSDIYG